MVVMDLFHDLSVDDLQAVRQHVDELIERKNEGQTYKDKLQYLIRRFTDHNFCLVNKQTGEVFSLDDWHLYDIKEKLTY